MLLFIVKALRGMLPKYIPSLLYLRRNNYLTRSSIEIQLEVPGVRSEHGKLALSYYAPWLRNDFQINTPLEAIPYVRCMLLF